MYDLDSGAVVALGILSCDQMKLIADAARTMGDPLARLVELAIYLPCDAQAICRAPVELLDPLRGALHLQDEQCRWNCVPLGPRAKAAVDQAAGDRTHGPLILDPDGDCMTVDRDARDYAIQLIAEQDPRTGEFGWDLDAIRLSCIFQLRAAGFSWPTIRKRAGEATEASRLRMSWQTDRIHRPKPQAAWRSPDMIELALSEEYVIRSAEGYALNLQTDPNL